MAEVALKAALATFLAVILVISTAMAQDRVAEVSDVAQQFADMLANEKKNQAPEN